MIYRNHLRERYIYLLVYISIYIILLTYFKGYHSFYPSIPIYPNNEKEIKFVIQSINTRTQDDINFFYKTNKSVVYAFLPFVNENTEELSKIILNPLVITIVLFSKTLINRSRPEQVDNSIIPLNKDTAQTPSYPAGHAFQAYVLYKYLSKKYPDKEKLFKELALKCDECRIKAGLHYPSDGIYSRQLVNYFYN